MKIYLAIIIILVILNYICIFKDNESEDFTNIKAPCNIPELLDDVITEYKIKKDNNDWEYFIPCEYDSCEKKVLEFETDTTKRKLFLIDGCDNPSSKMELWKILKNHYGKAGASKLIPTCHLLFDKADLDAFKIHFNEKKLEKPNHMFVLKNYAQRQEGIKLSRDLDEILDGYNNGWYLVQDYLYKPYLINKRKINFRYYILIVCKGSQVNGYIHKNGFVYYTPDFYDEDAMDIKKHITTGYIDRKIYDDNPLTLDDFRTHLDKIKPNLSKTWDQNVRFLMNSVIIGLAPTICKNSKLSQHIRFQIFGADIAPTEDLSSYLMEINKGPDLNSKDERDKQEKLGMQRDIFKVIEDNKIDGKYYNDSRFEKIF